MAAPLTIGLGWFPDDVNGLNRYLRDLAAAFAEAAVGAGEPPPPVVVAGPAAAPPPYVRVAGSLHEPLPLRLVRIARAAHDVAGGVDVVDGHFAGHAVVHRFVPALRSKPLVVHFQGPWADESVVAGTAGPLRVAAKRALEHRAYRRAARAIVLSHAFKRLLVERYGVSPWKVVVIPPGVDLDRFAPGDRASARQELGLGDGEFVGVAPRRLVPRTGVDVLIEAWAAVSATIGPARCRLLIVGDGTEREALGALAADLGVEGSIRFLGRVDEDVLVTAYRAADVCVIPTTALEGFGLVVLESLACGTPVIGTDSGGLAEAIALLDPGLVVPTGRPEPLARRLRAAAVDGAALPSAASCRAVAERHAWPDVAAAHRRLYDAVVSPSPATDLRVVYLDHTAQPSGAELSLLRILRALQGVSPHVVLGSEGPVLDRLAADGVSVELRPLPARVGHVTRGDVRWRGLGIRVGVDAARHVVALARHLRRLRPDLVHTNSLKAAVYGGLAGRLAGVPVVWHIHDRVADDYLPAPAVRLLRALARRVPRHVVVNSEATARTLPGVATTVVAEAVPLPADPVVLRSSRTGLRIGMVGRICAWKGQALFLGAFADAFPEATATAVVTGGPLFGEADLEDDLRRLVKTLGIDDRVEFDGHIDDVERRMRELDIVVHASTVPEPFGLVVAEAMALGLPVVAADAGGPAEMIEHGVSGLLYPMGDRGSLAVALSTLAGDPELRRRLGEEARRRAAGFDPARAAARVRAVYDAVLGR